jgi:malonyl-CoA O-methyltransferase
MSELKKSDVRASFDRAAEAYDAVAVLQREVGTRVMERLDLVRMQPQVLLDVGAGTGWCSATLAQRYPRARMLALDLAPAMLHRARQRFSALARWRRGHAFICGDAEALPVADASCDLLFSNLALQWCPDLERAFSEFRRVLRPGGLLMFSTFGPDTLKELRTSWAAADGAVHVNRFVDMHDVGDALVRAGLADPVMDMEHITLTYRDVGGLMRDLKGLGAHNVNAARQRGLTGKRRLQAMRQAYEAFRRDGVLPATHEVVYGHAWAPEASTGVPQGDDGVVRVPIERVHRRSG